MRLLFLLSLLVIQPSIQAETIRHMNVESKKNRLVLNILKLALSKNANHYRYIASSDINSNIVRNKKKVKSGELSVLWAGTSQSLENDLLPIRIPILKGLLGHRLLIIRTQDQTLFSKINSLEGLSKYQAGQGTFWEDTSILRDNGITTITTNKFQNLFPMLAGKRFDFFPRAIHEPWVELDEFSQYDLSVENHLLLVYPFAMYYFVSPENTALAKQIEKGLNRAIDDGSYDQLFFSSAIVKNALKKANLQKRTIISLKNSKASPETPIKTAKYWINIKKLPKTAP